MRVGVLTVSDSASQGRRRDVSGDTIRGMVTAAGAEVVEYAIVPDEQEAIASRLAAWADSGGVDVVFTTGGTGLGPRDVTPEATLKIVERQAPGLAELLRAEGWKKTPNAVLGRGVAGLRGRCLVVNLPGSPRAVQEGLEVLLPILPHALEMMAGAGHQPG